VVRAAEALHQDALAGQQGRVRAGQPVAAGDVHGEEVGALGTGRDAGSPTDEGVTLGASGEGHHHPLARLPGGVDAVLGPVAVELVVDLVGQPQQGQLAQRGQVADPEVVAQGGVDLLGLIDVAVGHPPP